jgi:putative ABC transport system permease protein
MNALLNDLRHGARALARERLFTAATVFTLGLGIGIVTSLFAVVDAVVLAPMTAHGDAVVRIWKHDAERNIDRMPLAYPELTMWRERARSVRAIAAISYADAATTAVRIDGDAIPVTMAPVSADFFEVMHGGAPLLGRWFEAADEGRSSELAAVVSEAFWRRVGGGDPSFIGRRLMFPGGTRALLVVGVAPASLDYPLDTDVWVPIDGYFTGDGGIANLNVRSRRFANFNFLARLAPAVSFEQVHAELEVINRGISAQFPEDFRMLPVVVEPLLNATVGTVRPLMLFLFASAALVFLAAGGNVAALLVMRDSAQSRAVALRIALGAGRWHLARQTICESALLALGSVMFGLLVAQAALSIARAVAGTEIPRLDAAAMDATTFAFALAASLLWVLTFGTAAMWRRRSLEAGQLTQQLSVRSTHSVAMLRVMVVSQVTAAVVIATAAGLLVKSFVHLQGVDRGFAVDNLLAFKLLLPDAQYPTPPAREQFYDRLVPRVTTLPGVVAATTVHLLPGTGRTGLSAPMMFEGQQLDEARQNPFATWEPVLPSYFHTLGIPIVRGRALTAADDGAARPVSVVSESVARRYWPGQDPIGKRVRLSSQFDWTTVVGVAADTRYREVTRDWLTVYFPAKQFFFFSPGALVVRTAGNPSAVITAIRRTVGEAEPAAAVLSVDTMQQATAEEIARPRAAMAVAALFALTAIFIAAAGVYGVFSYDITQRTRELAIHSAVGASPRQILDMTLRHGLAIGAVGAALGLGAAAMLTRYLTTLLFEVRPLDATAFVGAGAGLLMIVVFASLAPARRAASVDPVLLLRSD